MTAYKIFAKDGDRWLEEGEKEASSAKAAIHSYLKANDQDVNGLEYVAVPARSWKPVTVSVQTALKFS